MTESTRPTRPIHTGRATAQVAPEQSGWRADRALCALVQRLNRRGSKILFRERLVRLNGKVADGSERVTPGDTIEFPDPGAAGDTPFEKARAPRLTTPHGRHLLRLYEDADILVISKPAEIPVHRGQGGFTRRDTLEDVLERAYPPPPNSQPGQQGYYFVHRLDMETSGCLLIAKSDKARDRLIQDFMKREIHKEYLAVVTNEVEWKSIEVRRPIRYIRSVEEQPAARSFQAGRAFYKSRQRTPKAVMRGQKMGVALEEGSEEGKASETHFFRLRRFKGFSLIRAMPLTGRTHQIRVHLKSVKHPLAYDPLYGRITPLRMREFDLRSSETERGEEIVLNRLPLHAWRLGFKHPATGQEMKFEAPLPRDLKEFLKILKKYRGR